MSLRKKGDRHFRARVRGFAKQNCGLRGLTSATQPCTVLFGPNPSLTRIGHIKSRLGPGVTGPFLKARERPNAFATLFPTLTSLSPTMSHMPMDSKPPKQKSTGMSRRWPLAFFLAAIVAFIVGGALVGVWASKTSDCFGDSSSYDYTNDDFNCTTKDNGEYYGAIACFIIGAVCKFIGWVLLIMYCVKRRRSHQKAAASMYYTVPMDAPQQPYGGQPPYPPAQYPPQYPAQEYPMHPDTAYQSPAYYSKELPTHYA